MVKIVDTASERLRAFWTTPHRLYAASLLRVGLGVIVLFTYLVHIHQRGFLWGAHGELDWAFYRQIADPWSLYRISGSALWTETLYWAGVAVSLAYILGIAPRITSIAFYVLVRSMMNRNYLSLDGGQNLLLLLSFYLMFADTGRHLVFARIRLPDSWRLSPPAVVRRLVAVVHNGAMAIIAGQICMLYFWSGFYKVTGHKWQDGTAIYYVMRAFEFSLPNLSPLFYHSAFFVTGLTYATLVFQMSFPVLMWNKRLKPYIFVAALGFHTAIAVFMGLVVFSATMIVADLAIFSDSFFIAIIAFTQHIAMRFENRKSTTLATEGTSLT